MTSQNNNYPRKSKRNIKLFLEEVEVKVLEYSPDPNNFIIMQDEMYRLAYNNNIVIEELVDCGSVVEQSFFPAYNYGSHQPVEPWNKVTRFYATYKIVRYAGLVGGIVDAVFFGSGSAGHDNIAEWIFKSKVYEIAHKRAKVNGIRQALGLFEYKIEDLDDNKMIESQNPKESDIQYDGPHNPEQYNKDEPATQMQGCAMYGLLSRMNSEEVDKIHMNSILVSKSISYTSFCIGDKLSEDLVVDAVQSKLTKPEAASLINEFGNFSHKVEKPR